MIFDSLNNHALYEPLHPKFCEAFAFIRRALDEGLALGRYELDGDALFAIVQEYSTKPIEDCVFEGHRKYIDIQYIIHGSETMGVAELSKMTVSTAYNEQKDLTLFEPLATASKITVHDDEFAIFFPHDAHCPAIATEEPAPLAKIVVKVRV